MSASENIQTESIIMFRGQARQDEFVALMLSNKPNGHFLEIGSNDPIVYNNTYYLEKELNWSGLMVEYNPRWKPEYQKHRISDFIIHDAVDVDYATHFHKHNYPHRMDYLQIDLEAGSWDKKSSMSALRTLKNLAENILGDYTFNLVTFEHDVYAANQKQYGYPDYIECEVTRSESRDIFDKFGYMRIFSDVQCNDPDRWPTRIFPFEDWYVHSSFEADNKELVAAITTGESITYQNAIQKINTFNNR